MLLLFCELSFHAINSSHNKYNIYKMLPDHNSARKKLKEGCVYFQYHFLVYCRINYTGKIIWRHCNYSFLSIRATFLLLNITFSLFFLFSGKKKKETFYYSWALQALHCIHYNY